MKSILDRSFRYTPSSRTDLKKTFARIRRELHLEAKFLPRVDLDANANTTVLPIKRRTAPAVDRKWQTVQGNDSCVT